MIKIPQAIIDSLFINKYYRKTCLYGGRGSGKSWGVADYLIITALQKETRILCTREYQSSIKDSVHRLLVDRIQANNFQEYFTITRDSIRAFNGSEFIFKGLALHIEEIKSTEGVDICWVEEAEKVGDEHWDILIPTIRKDKSKIIITFNPEDEENATYQRFVINKAEDTLTRKINYNENPFFNDVLKNELEYDKKYNYEKYLWKWEGYPRKVNNAVVFRNKYKEEDFITPEKVRFLFGIDWGFAQDPTVLVRCFINDGYLYIDKEAYGVGVDLDELPILFDNVEECKKYIIKADNSRPETISYMNKKGFRVQPARKWQGSIEDGIEYIKSFKGIIIHPSCKHTLDEFKTYSYKKDKNNGDILPILIDKNNHCIDAIRYSLDGYIKSKNNIKDLL